MGTTQRTHYGVTEIAELFPSLLKIEIAREFDHPPTELERVAYAVEQSDRVLIESFAAAFALQILQMTHDRPSPQNAFVGWGFGRKIAN